MTIITLSLVSHTNVGKTTLARTLLRADVGEVRDAAHVTEFADGHELIGTPEGDRLRLWDTPGFGDSARLVQRLRASRQPLGWFLSQVWDRWRDRPFWASQQALRHVQADSDVLLYLVNAAESPSQVGYVTAEMELLAWVGKPVIVLLNQLGAPRESSLEEVDVAAWRDHLARWPLVQTVLPLDAFARCWVHEHTLLQAVQAALQGPQVAAMVRLAAAWSAQRLATFDAAVQELAQSVARAASARVRADDGPALSALAVGVRGKLRQWGQAVGNSLAQARGPSEASAPAGPAPGAAELALLEQLQTEVHSSTSRLLALHGLDALGDQASAQILQRVAGQFAQATPVPEGKAALVGGALSGALVGLKADVASGGLTLGGGLLVGAVLGALGAAGVARGINVVRGFDQTWLRLSDEALGPWVEAALLRYLAVAHFGRGRGDWVQSEAPPHWHATVAAALLPEREALRALWRTREAVDAAPAGAGHHRGGPQTQTLAVALAPLLRRTLSRVFAALYPHAYHLPQ